MRGDSLAYLSTAKPVSISCSVQGTPPQSRLTLSLINVRFAYSSSKDRYWLPTLRFHSWPPLKRDTSPTARSRRIRFCRKFGEMAESLTQSCAIRRSRRRCIRTRSDAIFLLAVTLARNSRKLRAVTGDFGCISSSPGAPETLRLKLPNHYINRS